jgi:hypothetical protein
MGGAWHAQTEANLSYAIEKVWVPPFSDQKIGA